jgi:hypothetical protein
VEWSPNLTYTPSLETVTSDTFFAIDSIPAIESLASIGGSFTDALPDSQMIYWRVKAMDYRDWATTAFPGESGWVFRVILPQSNQPQLPEEFKVNNAYPNPFNSSFTIPIEMDENDGVVNIQMWNLLGHIVFETDLTLGAGYHKFTFNDNNSNGLSAGVYFLEVNHASSVHRQKVVLMK